MPLPPLNTILAMSLLTSANSLTEQTGLARPLDELGTHLGHHFSGHALGASKCLFWGINMSLSKHCRFHKLLYVCMRKHFA